jgi:hypothetical protein
MKTINSKVEQIKEYIEVKLNDKNIDYDISLETDDELGGYCYNITTKYASCIFSDSTVTETPCIYVLNTNVIQWGIDEGLTEEQMENLKVFKPLNSVDEMLLFLSTQKLKPLNV